MIVRKVNNIYILYTYMVQNPKIKTDESKIFKLMKNM